MISIKENIVSLNGRTETILRYEVWFQSPFGLLTNREEAIQRAIANDLDPDLVLIPVSVAITETLYEIVGR